MPAAQSAIRWVAHPLTVAAAVVLLVNDHVLKAAFPGAVTGKLSDVAGLVVAPALVALALGLLMPRLSSPFTATAALLLTGAGFAWVKATGAGAEAASALWSAVSGPSVILADPTDLLTLPALGLAWWAWRRSPSTAPIADSLVFRLRLFVALPLVVLATAATSALPPPDAVLAVEEEGGAVMLYTTYGVTHGVPGGDWSRLEDVPPGSPGYNGPSTDVTGAARVAQHDTACVPGEPAHCYRVRGGAALGVDETLDGGTSWRTAWEVPPDRWQWLVERHQLVSYEEDLLATTDIAVRAVPGGHEVVVAAGVEGLVVRSAGGEWERVAVHARGGEFGPAWFDAGPLALAEFGRGVSGELGIAVLLGGLAMVIGTAIAAGKSKLMRAKVWSLVAGVLLGLSVPVLGLASWTEAPVWTVFLTLALLVCHTTFALVGRALPRGRAALLLAAALLPAAAFAAPYLGWSLALPAAYSTATLLALIAAALGLAGFVLLALRILRPITPEPAEPRKW